MSVLYVKRWGLTATFRIDGDLVVFKEARPNLFPSAPGVYEYLAEISSDCVARLLAQKTTNRAAWSAFEYIDGNTVSGDSSAEQLRTVALTLADVQLRSMARVETDLPSYDIAAIPDRLAEDTADQPEEVRLELARRLPQFRQMATELARYPGYAVDHPDMNLSNVLIREDGRVVILDWEEATMGCPLFSVERLLEPDAAGAHAEAVRRAYLDALSVRAGSLEEAYRLSRCVVPLQRAVEARRFARGLRRPDPHTRVTTDLIREALARLRELSS